MLTTEELLAENARLRARIDALAGTRSAAVDFERDRAQRFLDTAEVMLIAADTDGTIQLANRFACGVLGWTSDELVGRNWFETCIPERLREGWKEKYRQLLAGELPVGENAVLTKSGGERMIAWRNTVQYDEAGRATGTLSSGADVTDLHTVQAQFQHSQKMEAVGQLAGGIAHDFNNLLTVIIGFSNLVLDESAPDDPRRPDIEEIRHAGLQASALTRQLLTFSRKQIVETEVLDVNRVVDQMRELLGRLIGEDVRIVIVREPVPEWVLADHGQLEQIVMNLAVNARDAMPNGGTLTIGVSHAKFAAPHCVRGGSLRYGEYVKLTVADTGTGITPAVMNRLFEPFFTTKTVGKGTGLGLATVLAIVNRCGGCVDVETVVGAGTAFIVYLPLAAAGPDQDRVAAPSCARRACAELILVVDDDRGVRDLARRLLEREGYRVITAADAVAARHEFSSNPSIDLVLTDVVMPGDSGPELVRSLRELRPELKAVFMSGYAEDAIAHHGVLDHGLVFLHKPFTAETLALKLGEQLDAVSSDTGPSQSL